MTQCDVLIVGTRCSGAPLAMLLARKGHKVIAVDRAQFPSDTVSTHFMWPRTTSLLQKWGLLEKLAATGCPAIERVTADYGPVAVSGRPGPVDGTEIMYCPRRTVLDAMLVEAARGAGAEIHESTTFREAIREGDRIVGAHVQDRDGHVADVRATVLVGADGVWSSVARAIDAVTEVHHDPLTCGYYAYWRGVPTEGVEFYVRAGRDILVFPTHDGLTCVWAGRSRSEWNGYRANVEGTYREIISLAPDLSRRIDRAEQASPFRGTSKLPNFYRQSFGQGWALVGDAAYHRDPLPGMGIGDAFLGAQLLADAIDGGLTGKTDLESALASYQSTFREKTRPVFEYTLRAAGLKDPSAMLPVYAKIAESSEKTRQFMNVLAGTVDFKQFFTPSNISRLLA
jgi:flavin-dependent dehydrogenase